MIYGPLVPQTLLRDNRRDPPSVNILPEVRENINRHRGDHKKYLTHEKNV